MQKLGERRQWFPLNRFCIQKLIKNKLARKPDDTKHRVVKKKRRTIEPEQSCACVKKKQAKTMEWTWLHITCCRRMVDYPTCQVLGHSMNSSCSVRGVDCEHHKDGEVVNQQIYSTDWAKSHTKEVFSRRPEAGRRYSTTTEGTWRGDPLQICPNDVRHTAPSKCCRSILQVKLLMLQSS